MAELFATCSGNGNANPAPAVAKSLGNETLTVPDSLTDGSRVTVTEIPLLRLGSSAVEPLSLVIDWLPCKLTPDVEAVLLDSEPSTTLVDDVDAGVDAGELITEEVLPELPSTCVVKFESETLGSGVGTDDTGDVLAAALLLSAGISVTIVDEVDIKGAAGKFISLAVLTESLPDSVVKFVPEISGLIIGIEDLGRTTL